MVIELFHFNSILLDFILFFVPVVFVCLPGYIMHPLKKSEIVKGLC